MPRVRAKDQGTSSEKCTFVNTTGTPLWFTLEHARVAAEHKYIFNIVQASIYSANTGETFTYNKQAMPSSTILSEWDSFEFDVKPMRVARRMRVERELDDVIQTLKATIAVMLVVTGNYKVNPRLSATSWWLYVTTTANLAYDPQDGLLLGRDIIEQADIVQAGSMHQMMREKLEFSKSSLWNSATHLLAKLAEIKWETTETALQAIISELYPSLKAQQSRTVISIVSEIFTDNWDAALLLAAYTFRLIPQLAEDVYNHYTKNYTEIGTWSKLTNLPPMTEGGLELLKTELQAYGYTLFWPVAESFFQFRSHWRATKKWFGSRWEWAGLSVTSYLLIVSTMTSVPRLIRAVATNDTFPNMWRNMLTTFLYAYLDSPQTNVRKWSEWAGLTCSLSKRDRYYGRFCRMASKNFLAWTSFYHDARFSSLLVGVIAAKDAKGGNAPPPTVIPYEYQRGRIYMKTVSLKIEDLMSEKDREANKKAHADGFCAHAALPESPVRHPSVTSSAASESSEATEESSSEEEDDDNAEVGDNKTYEDDNAGVRDNKTKNDDDDAEVEDYKTNDDDVNAGVRDNKTKDDGDSAGVNDNKANDDENNAGVEDNKAKDDDDNAVVGDNKTNGDDDNAGVEDNKTKDDDDNAVVGDNKTNDDDDNAEIKGNKTKDGDDNAVVEDNKTNDDDDNAGIRDNKTKKDDDNAGIRDNKTKKDDDNAVDEDKKTDDDVNAGAEDNKTNAPS